MQKQSHLSPVKTISFLSVLCVLLAVTALVYAGRANRLQRDAARTSQQALSVLCAQLDTMETALQKGTYTQSAPMLEHLGAKLQNAAAGAKLSLSLLTDEQSGAAGIFRFLSQAGDFTASLQKGLQNGKALTATQRQSLRDLYAKSVAEDPAGVGMGNVPVCFLATNHTTGGNSGSPVINADGDLIGINFDRVWEGTMSDIVYDPAFCRNISLDIRYLLFVVEHIGGATWLLDEMQFADPPAKKGRRRAI